MSTAAERCESPLPRIHALRGISAPLHVIACIEDPVVIEKILTHLERRKAAGTSPHVPCAPPAGASGRPHQAEAIVTRSLNGANPGGTKGTVTKSASPGEMPEMQHLAAKRKLPLLQCCWIDLNAPIRKVGGARVPPSRNPKR